MNLFTNPTAAGTVFRDLFIAVGTLITLAGVVGWLDPAQVSELRATIDSLSGQLPAILAALGVVMAAGMSIYRAVFKSQSTGAEAVGKAFDGKKEPVVVITPPGQPDVVVDKSTVVVTPEGKPIT
jgi:hypothetical protein